MKQLLILIAAITLTSCSTPGIKNPGLNENEVFIHVGSKTLQVHRVTLTEQGHFLYILTPKDTAVSVNIVGYEDSKNSQTAVIEVK